MNRMIAVSMLALVASWAKAADPNLCFNADFTHTNSPLEGWNYDYQWEGNSHYMGNHNTVSVIPEQKGRRHVLCINPTWQSKVESKPIKLEPGFRYRCTIEILGGGANADGSERFYFNGYQFAPGVAPYDDPELKDLRRILKSDPWVGAHVRSWRAVTFDFPHKEVSDLEGKHLKKCRYITAKFLASSGEPTYIANIKIVKLNETYKVKKPAPETSEGSTTKPGGTAASRTSGGNKGKTTGSATKVKPGHPAGDDSGGDDGKE